jgi:hypothetical protein
MQTWIGLIVILLTLPSSVFARVYARTIADTTQIWDTGIEWSCSGRFLPVSRVSGDTIYVTERDTMQIATCLCYIDVCTKVTGLQPGSYTAVVHRRHEVRFPDSLRVYEEYAGSATFTIVNPSSAVAGVSLSQSPCHTTPESVPGSSSMPEEPLLLSTYPNPFNPKTVVSCQWPVVSLVRLVVHDILGREIVTLLEGYMEAGRYEVTFDGTNFSSGVYICRMTVGDRSSRSGRVVVQSLKMVLLR